MSSSATDFLGGDAILKEFFILSILILNSPFSVFLNLKKFRLLPSKLKAEPILLLLKKFKEKTKRGALVKQ